MQLARTFLGVDPGTTTGLAVVRLTHEGFVAAHYQVEGIHDAAYWIRKHCEGNFVELVYESFYIGDRTLRAGKQGVFDALNLIGWIVVEIEDWIGIRTYPQSPSVGKTVANDVLKGMGLYSSKHRHGTDAMRHIVRHHLTHLPKSNVSKLYAKVVVEIDN